MKYFTAYFRAPLLIDLKSLAHFPLLTYIPIKNLANIYSRTLARISDNSGAVLVLTP